MNELSPHNHDGVNSPQIDPRDLLGFPIYSFSSATAVTAFLNGFTPLEGTIILTVDISVPTYKIQVRINKGWRSTTLT